VVAVAPDGSWLVSGDSTDVWIRNPGSGRIRARRNSHRSGQRVSRLKAERGGQLSWHRRSFRVASVLGGVVLAAAVGAPATGASGAVAVAGPAAAAYQVGPITGISACGGQNAELEQAVDAKLGYAYEEWTGCRGIAFARSTDGGRTWDAPVSLPGTVGSNLNTWDPAVAAAPDGTVYAAFMLSRGGQCYPVVDASFDHGQDSPSHPR
jgi:hypothetical protein